MDYTPWGLDDRTPIDLVDSGRRLDRQAESEHLRQCLQQLLLGPGRIRTASA